MENREQQKIEFSDITQTLKSRYTCGRCKHDQSWECGSKVFHYCGIRKSKLTHNGLLKIKFKNEACSLFEPK